mgnify:CR=1 FL=1
MYTHSTARQLAHLSRKIDKGIVYQFGDGTFQTNLMEYYKAQIPFLTAPRTAQDLWEELGFKWSTTQRKADVVLAGNYLENTMDITNRLKEIYARGKVNSMLTDLTHKFVECREMITNITIKKKSTKELVCPQ